AASDADRWDQARRHRADRSRTGCLLASLKGTRIRGRTDASARLAAMRRRGVTVLIGAVLLIALSQGLTQFTVPYAEMGPGPTVDTLGVTDGRPIISITGATTSKSQGQLRLVTISVQPD